MTTLSKSIGLFMMFALLTVSYSNDAHALFRMKTLYNIVDAPLNFSTGDNPSLVDIEGVLMASFEEKSWNVRKINDNKFEASILVRERHFAKVDVLFDTEKYSILYNDSDMLLYDGKKIHKNYNNWVKSVEKIVGFRVKNINFGTQY